MVFTFSVGAVPLPGFLGGRHQLLSEFFLYFQIAALNQTNLKGSDLVIHAFSVKLGLTSIYFKVTVVVNLTI